MVHEHLKDRAGDRDLQRGRGARALRDRRPAARRLSERPPTGGLRRIRCAILGDEGARRLHREWSTCSPRTAARRARSATPSRAGASTSPTRSAACEVRGPAAAGRIADVGAGAGFPGHRARRGASPAPHVDLIESTARKCEFMRRALERARDRQRARGLRPRRDLGAGPPARRRPRVLRGRHRPRGRSPGDAGRAGLAAAGRRRRPGRLEGPPRPRRGGRAASAPRRGWRWSRSRSWVGPYAGSENRHLHVIRKSGADARGPSAPPGNGEEAPVRARADACPAALGKVERRWASSTRSRTRRAGWGRRPPPSTSPPAPPPPAARCCSVDLDPQCNATVALGVDRDVDPVLLRLPDRRDARSPRRPARRAPTTSGSSRRAATWPAPRSSCRESRAPSANLREMLGPVRERFAVTLLDCPPSLGPVTVNALVAADRVIVPVQAEYLALEGLVQFLDTLELVRRELNPALVLTGRRDHHARRADPARARRRARAPRPLSRARLRHGDPAQRPRRRGAELRRAR